jgi:hypothetical protein
MQAVVGFVAQSAATRSRAVAEAHERARVYVSAREEERRRARRDEELLSEPVDSPAARS